MFFYDLYSHLGRNHGSRVCVTALALRWVQLFLVVFDPVCDAQEDAEPMQAVQVLRVRLSHGDKDLFRLGLAQDTGERLQEHLEETKAPFLNHSCNREALFDVDISLCKTTRALAQIGGSLR